ncbi:N6-adenosine-methyltransferase catalytic subunit [Lingula anatina]|uniref:mRNA m(6)A methyltransferase n=1 Tax=Lingula anatina TaxID=7574 RepID=A0A1S3J0D7_LINAN|nr:N6-adenosine-methyltransferase catalytic subunit [Lingula anatina]|eukprot:XP_013403912.1 N6-adenosine-methyltransferase catalytic subunit [Lingula anatina]
MSDTWSDIQAVKSKQSSLREKLMQRRREREGLLKQISGAPASNSSTLPTSDPTKGTVATSTPTLTSQSPAVTPASATTPKVVEKTKLEPEVERQVLLSLQDVGLNLPVESVVLCSSVEKALEKEVALSSLDDLLEKFATQQLISIKRQDASTGKEKVIVESVDLAKLGAFSAAADIHPSGKKRKRDNLENKEPRSSKQSKGEGVKDGGIESLLSMQSAKERENKKMNEEILELLTKPTAKEQSLVEKFKSQGVVVQEFCQYGTKEECGRLSREPCKKLHFRKIIHKHTDESLGDCSFLNTCFHMETCKYVHYEIDYPEVKTVTEGDKTLVKSPFGDAIKMTPPQWVCCDLRTLDMTILGKCSVIMADPPWDIHMELPYGTMADDEMRSLPVKCLQDDGYMFLWVTGRAMELGRECLQIWGYDRVDELIWVKTNQLQRIIRTGRTGHWLNHGKEHCLIGVKGNPQANRGMDCDVLVAEVRATSHKPDEIYGIIERLSPGTRKVELFGRPHNIQPNWITLGNQLDGIRLVEPDIVKRYKKRYPEGYKMGGNNS